MLQEMMRSPEQLAGCSIPGPITTQIFDFSDASELFPETLRTFEASSSSTGLDGATTGGADTSNVAFCPFTSMDPASLSALLDTPPHDSEPEAEFAISDYSSLSSMFPIVIPYIGEQQRDQVDQIVLADVTPEGYSSYSHNSVVQLSGESMQLPQQPSYLPPVYEDRLLQQPPAYQGLDPLLQCTFLDISTDTLYSTGMMTSSLSSESPGFFPEGMTMGMEAGNSSHELKYQGQDRCRIGIYEPESMPSVYCSGDIQVNGDTNHHLMSSGCGCSTSTTSLPTNDITALNDPNCKVGRLSVEERKEKIHRYMKKRNERNFSKKIKYACRKTLADSRPRVRGRFAKNDELGEVTRHEYDGDGEVLVKEEGEDLLDSSDILAHINGMNAFNTCNYTLESWI